LQELLFLHQFLRTLFGRTKIGQNRFTVASALLPNKHEQIYKDLFCKTKSVCETENSPLDFVFVHHDCERAIINAVKYAFPNSKIELCYFHVMDAIRKYISSHGFRPILKNHEDFEKFFRRFCQLFFFPTAYCPRLLTLSIDELETRTKELPVVIQCLSYIKSPWAPDRGPIRPKSCLYHPDLTCLFESDDVILTNNDSEAYNQRFKKNNIQTYQIFLKY
jgi:hypothetical protein